MNLCLLTGILLFNQSGLLAQKTQIVYLSGTDKDHTVPWDFKCSAGRNSGTWSKIAVPSCWELQGFGTYHYGWEEDFKKNETGFYRYSFKADPLWKNRTVRIVFEGSMTDTEVKINGQLAGAVHQGSFYTFRYDITRLLKTDNLLEVKVNKISADTSVNRAERMSDFWVFGGIFRPVYLEILPKEFIDWTAIDAKADGSFLIRVYTTGIKNATHIEGRILTTNGVPVGGTFSSLVSRGTDVTTLTTRIDNVKTWDHEHPHLYKVELRLRNGDQVIHTVQEKFGFRTVEFRHGAGFFVNGKKIVFKGVNRHSFWPTSGRTTSKVVSILDVQLMQDMNMNSVRMSHYPPDSHFLDVCDSLGLLVLDELGGWQKKYDTPVGRKLVYEMIRKDVNHPSIVIWDNGNEGGNNHELLAEYARYDPQLRKVIHPWNIFAGTDTQHYKGYDCCAGSLYRGPNVFFPTEIIHGLYDGGNGAGLNDHWNLMMGNPLSAGCFLWAFADEGIRRVDLDSIIDVKDNRAPDGIVGPFREREGSYYTIKEIWSPVQIRNKILTNQFDGTFDIENRYFYTNLEEITFSWKLVRFQDQHQEEILSQGQRKGPSIEPQQTGRISFEFPDDHTKADALYLTATDPKGAEIFTWSWPLKTPDQLNRIFTNGATDQKPITFEDDSSVTVRANGVSVSFSKKHGRLLSVKNSSSVISLTTGPSLAWGSATFKSLRHFRDGDNYVVETSWDGDLKYLKYIMTPGGILKMDYGYSHYRWGGENEADFLGINFGYPEEKITGVRFLGYGPYRVWRNRMKGGRFGIWNKKYNNTVTGESWEYPEFKGYYRNMYWVVIENKESPFMVFTDTPNLFLRLYTPQKPRGAKNDFTSPSFPDGDISFLHGINGIGTKFDRASDNGPEGAKNKFGWELIRGTLYFDFDLDDH